MILYAHHVKTTTIYLAQLAQKIPKTLKSVNAHQGLFSIIYHTRVYTAAQINITITLLVKIVQDYVRHATLTHASIV